MSHELHVHKTNKRRLVNNLYVQLVSTLYNNLRANIHHIRTKGFLNKRSKRIYINNLIYQTQTRVVRLQSLASKAFKNISAFKIPILQEVYENLIAYNVTNNVGEVDAYEPVDTEPSSTEQDDTPLVDIIPAPDITGSTPSTESNNLGEFKHLLNTATMEAANEGRTIDDEGHDLGLGVLRVLNVLQNLREKR